jgi:hypothetical protein
MLMLMYINIIFIKTDDSKHFLFNLFNIIFVNIKYNITMSY